VALFLLDRFDSLDSRALCPRCGVAAEHKNSQECIAALRNTIAEFDLRHLPPADSRRGRHRKQSTSGKFSGS
jgi:hypothetical protein